MTDSCTAVTGEVSKRTPPLHFTVLGCEGAAGCTSARRVCSRDRGGDARRAAMKVEIKNWHAVASWTWTTEDDVCGICHMPLDGCAPGAAGPGDDSPVVWGRVRAERGWSRTAGSRPRPPHPLFFSRALPAALAVHALLPSDVHHDMAAQQEHVPDLQAQVGVPDGAQARARHPRKSPRGRGLQRRQPAAGGGGRRCGLTPASRRPFNG